MFGLGVPELLIILVIVIFIYGGNRMPQIGEGLGKMISEFKKANKASTEPTPLESRQDRNSAVKPLPKQGQPD